MKSVQSIRDEYLKPRKPEAHRLVARPGAFLKTNHTFFAARWPQPRKFNSNHNKLDELNFNARLLRDFYYLCEHNILFFLTVTKQFVALRKLLHPKAEPKKMVMLKRQIKRKRRRLVAKRHHAFTLPALEEQPFMLREARVNTSNVLTRYRFFLPAEIKPEQVLILSHPVRAEEVF
jgi:hypothetical protein